MFGAFRITNPLSSGLLWKTPWRLSKFQKRRHRLRLRAVDSVVATVDAALAKKGQTLEALERWKAEMPTEAEMLPKDKYTMFDRKAKRYRKGIHSMSSPALCRRQASHWLRTLWLTTKQSCPSGRGFRSGSTPPVTKSRSRETREEEEEKEEAKWAKNRTENGVFIPQWELQADPQ
ncbi:hypothetical protein ACJZ2D_014896 [Fusarium nematophilum]